MYDGSPTAGCPYCNNGNETSKTDHTMKKIALPTRGTEVDDHFGHCECYTIFTLDDNGQPLSREIVPAADGCGCKSDIAPRLHAMGVTTLLAGNMGDGAKNVLQRNGIAVIRGCHGPLETVVEAFVKGTLADSGAACAPPPDQLSVVFHWARIGRNCPARSSWSTAKRHWLYASVKSTA